jgi:hypothetical protein
MQRSEMRMSRDDSTDAAGKWDSHEALERIVVRLLVVAERCGDQTIRHELMQVIDELVELLSMTQNNHERKSTSRPTRSQR